MAHHPNFWRFAGPLKRMKKADLEEVLDALPDHLRGDRRVYPSTKAGLIRFIEDARAQDRDHRHDEARARPASARRSLCQITASEVNAWLRTLPPIDEAEEIGGGDDVA